jgi:hypothetical protein
MVAAVPAPVLPTEDPGYEMRHLLPTGTPKT